MSDTKNGSPQDIVRVNDGTDAKSGFEPVSDKDFISIFSEIPKPTREKLTAGYDLKSLAKVFEDEAMMQTVDCFLKNDLSICRTARALYMHRNTLMYRLNSIRRQTGLDLRKFEMAVTFKFLHYLYVVK